MPKRTDTREILLAEGRHALLTHGYDGVSIGTILTAAGVPKGSFYHFFQSKESFAEAVLDDYERFFIALGRRLFDNAVEPPMKRIRSYFDELERMHRAEGPEGGCLFGVMAGNASVRSPAFRNKLTRIFSTWTDHLEAMLEKARLAGEVKVDIDVKAAAAFLVEAYQGALLHMRVEGRTGEYARFCQFALGSIASAGNLAKATGNESR